MIEQQIRPGNVLDQDVLDLLHVVKREQFVPQAYQNLAFADVEIPLPGGEAMLSPKLEARILQEIVLKKHETVLLVGTGSDYLAALLAHKSVLANGHAPSVVRRHAVYNLKLPWKVTKCARSMASCA
jgi:protein-L-isoaspartate(D-aspartate) O-methyltransferase